ncbi:uncharacterized protein BX663DRAFT_521123 [Cokeromyces recurvatus]|uniref:uncharacterized protein n=1 Tax=Cokeromyces recurvatus TaxID=90255 RepID=UPI00221E37F1|nr:uncharacterized protein BX663DRAFT_521123 [Cokeromyces recurvatus]KAI7899505.1 hypothetical protein BX663DRAFT_521123 [Cokeromyces recurvatus]
MEKKMTKEVPAKKPNNKKATPSTETSVKVATTEKNVDKKQKNNDAGSKRKRVSFTESERSESNAVEEAPKKDAVEEPATKKKAKKENNKKAVTKEDDSSDEEMIVKDDDEEEVEQADEEELTEEQEEALRKEILGDLVSSSEGEDSSDDDSDDIDANEDIVKLDGKKLEESKAETKKTFDKKASQSKATKSEEKGVIYLGRIPHGFYEKEMNGYFRQFGDITRLRLSRNKKTGKSKHYAFIEFASKDVAEIVAETMHNYLLMGHLLQCKLIPSENVHENLFKGADKVYKPFNYELRNRRIHNKKRTPDEFEAKKNKLIQAEKRLRQRIADAGIEYDFPSFS